jgi:hypothetical protein
MSTTKSEGIGKNQCTSMRSALQSGLQSTRRYLTSDDPNRPAADVDLVDCFKETG